MSETGSFEAGYSVVRERCLRCATCSTLAPGVFAIEPAGARVLRQPLSAPEAAFSEAARIGCPGHAIGRSASAAAAASAPDAATPWSPESASLFQRLFDEAESVRWRLGDIRWDAIEKDKVSPGMVRFIREVALSELTTYSATRRFLGEMGDDVELTNWLAVWFYEETKHPDALFRWLASFGVTVSDLEVRKGRVSAPFMRSRTGTLVMNILSELFASAGYQDIANHVKEPVLAHIARCLAGDEARHGASFYLFSERAIASARSPALERLQAVKVLYYWVQQADHVEHPVNQFHEKVSADPELREVLRELGTDYGPVLSRACRMIGTLVGRPIDGPPDVLPLLREMSAAAGEPAPAP